MTCAACGHDSTFPHASCATYEEGFRSRCAGIIHDDERSMLAQIARQARAHFGAYQIVGEGWTRNRAARSNMLAYYRGEG